MLRIKVPFLTAAALDDATAKLLREYAAWKGSAVAPPIDVDEIAEGLLGLELQVVDLRRLLGLTDVLGATWLEARRICIDESLEGKEGRFAFTVAHELGHWRLHRPLVEASKLLLPLFPARPGDAPTPAIVCRSRERKEPAEWQADQFAARLLMPASDVKAAMKTACEELPLALQGLEASRSARVLDSRLRDVAGQVMEVGAFTNVSNEAMCYRLLDLKLVVDAAQTSLRLF